MARAFGTKCNVTAVYIQAGAVEQKEAASRRVGKKSETRLTRLEGRNGIEDSLR